MRNVDFHNLEPSFQYFSRRDAGKISAEMAKAHAESEFEKYPIVQDRLFESDFDRLIKQVGAPNHDPEDSE